MAKINKKKPIEKKIEVKPIKEIRLESITEEKDETNSVVQSFNSQNIFEGRSFNPTLVQNFESDLESELADVPITKPIDNQNDLPAGAIYNMPSYGGASANPYSSNRMYDDTSGGGLVIGGNQDGLDIRRWRESSESYPGMNQRGEDNYTIREPEKFSNNDNTLPFQDRKKGRMF